jgi:hypothetical protein
MSPEGMIRVRRVFRSFLNNENGSVTVIVACAMVLILGIAALVIDVGVLYYNKVLLSFYVLSDAGSKKRTCVCYQYADLTRLIALPANRQDRSTPYLYFRRNKTKNLSPSKTIWLWP